MDLDSLNADEQVIWMKAWDAAPSGEQESAAIQAIKDYRAKKQPKQEEKENIFRERQKAIDKFF